MCSHTAGSPLRRIPLNSHDITVINNPNYKGNLILYLLVDLDYDKCHAPMMTNVTIGEVGAVKEESEEPGLETNRALSILEGGNHGGDPSLLTGGHGVITGCRGPQAQTLRGRVGA